MGVSKKPEKPPADASRPRSCRRRQSKIRILQTSAKAFRFKFPRIAEIELLGLPMRINGGTLSSQPYSGIEVKFNGDMCEFQKGKAPNGTGSQSSKAWDLDHSALLLCIPAKATERRSRPLSSSHEAAQTLAEDIRALFWFTAVPGQIFRRCLRSTSPFARAVALQAARWCRGT